MGIRAQVAWYASVVQRLSLKLPTLPKFDPSETVVLAGAGISIEEPSGIPRRLRAYGGAA